MKQSRFVCSAVLTLLCLASADAAELGANNVLVVTNYSEIREYTRTGSLVQTFTDPTFSSSRPIRDLATSGTREIYAFNGTFTGYVGRLDTVTGTWTHLTHPYFSVANNLTAGGLGLNNKYVFAADEAVSGELPYSIGQGIVRFNFGTGSAQRFANTDGTADVTVGLNGYVYAITPAGSPSGRYLAKYDPESLALVSTLDLNPTVGADHRAIAVNAAGELYVGDLDGDVLHCSPTGTLLHSTNVGGAISDVEIDSGGFVLITRMTGQVYKSDQVLSAPVQITSVTGYTDVFGAVVQPPVVNLPVSVSAFNLD